MSLYQSITNEALNEDRAADREVVERLKRNYLDNKEKIRPNNSLDGVRRSVFKQNISLMQKYIFKAFGYITSRNVYLTRNAPADLNLGDLSTILADIVITYNNLTTFLKQINYDRLFDADKQYIDNQMKSFIPSLESLEFDLKAIVPDEYLLPISNIKNDILLKNYAPVSYFGPDSAITRATRRRRQIGTPITRRRVEGEPETQAQRELTREENIQAFEEQQPPFQEEEIEALFDF